MVATRRAAALMLALLAVAPVGARPGSAQESGDPCSRFVRADATGVVADEELVEISGLVASGAHDDVLWAHNDSGDAPRLFAMSEDGAALGTYAVEGAEAVDWEDVGVGPGPDDDRSYLYVGDIGDNAAGRNDIMVYRVPEPEAMPDGTAGTLAGAEALELTYPDGPADAEALLVDPTTGDLFIVTKVINGTSTVLHANAADLTAGAPIALAAVGEVSVTDPGPVESAPFPGTLVTAADVSPDGSIVLLRTYKQVLAFARPDDGTITDALAGEPCVAPSVGEPQGEAVAFSGAGDAYLTASEVLLAPGGAAGDLPLHRFTVDPAAAVAPPARTTGGTGQPAPTAAPTGDTRRDADGSRLPWVLGALAVVVVVAGVALLARRRHLTSR